MSTPALRRRAHWAPLPRSISLRCAPHPGCKVYCASGPRDLGGSERSYVGVVVSCVRETDADFGGAVFRIDCMGSLAFDISARLCSVVAFVVDTGEVFCLVGTREAI